MEIIRSHIVLISILLLGLAVLWLVFRRRPGRISRSRAPRPWHPAVRIVCGVLGIGLLFALGVGTWREVRGGYGYDTSRQTPQSALHLPAKPPPALPTPTQPLAPGPGGAASSYPLREARVLYHLILRQGDYPIHAEELDVRFPEDAGKKLDRNFEYGGVEYRATMMLTSITAHCFENSPFRLSAEGSFNIEARGRGESWSEKKGGLAPSIDSVNPYHHSGKAYATEICTIYKFGPGIENSTKKPWSLVSSVSAPNVVLRVRLINRDDPLKPATLVEVAGSDWRSDRGVSSGSSPAVLNRPPAYCLIEALGVSSIILIFAAVLLAQVFVRRGLAFAGMLALCMGYAAVLDRLTVGFHSGKLADPQQPMEIRIMAAEALHSSYFYKETASRAAEWPVTSKP